MSIPEGLAGDEVVVKPPAEHEHSWKWQWQQNVTSRGYAMPPIEVCGCGTARRAADPEPVSESVTLPRDVVDLALDRLDKAARWAGEGAQAADARGHMEAWRALADALDAAGGEQP